MAISALLLVGAAVLGLWLSASAAIRRDYDRHLVGLAQAAASQVDPALHARLREPAQLNGPEYMQAVAPLRRLRAMVTDVRYVYTQVRDGDTVRFVLDAADPGDHDGDGLEDQPGVWQLNENPSETLKSVLGDGVTPGRAVAMPGPYTDEWGTFMTGLAPLLDQNGRQYGLAGVDVDASIYLSHLRAARNWALLGLLPAALLVVALSIGFFRVRLRSLLAAQALAEQQLRLSTIVEGTGVGTWEVQLDTARTYVDARCAAMLGHRPGELTQLTREAYLEMVHPDERAASLAAVVDCCNNPGRTFEIDQRMRHAAGHWVWITARGMVTERAADGRPLRLAGTHTDITARKAMELTLKESEGNFRSLFELSPIGIALTDLHTQRFLKVNDALVASTGYSREELLRMTYWDVTPPEWHEFEHSQVSVLHDSPYLGAYEKEYQRKDGSRYPVMLSGMRMRDATGRDVVWALVQDISERKKMEAELADAARLDRLTGLANRTLFMERLQEAVERVRAGRQRRFAVLFLDFDRFKLVNDSMGHVAGDELLRAIAGRLRQALRLDERRVPEGISDVIARFGGDEFLVLLNGLEGGADPAQVASRLQTALSAGYTIHGRELHSTASIGIVTSDQGLTDAEALVRNADMAMYEAKRAGRARSVEFDDSMYVRLTRRVAIESGLRQALGTPEFWLLYQPIFDLNSGRVVSVEALARWNHAPLGTVSPDEFIPVAEESGLIVSLGQWVLREACGMLARWRALQPETAPQTVSVNMSRTELALGERFLTHLRETLQHTGLPATCLQLEVTEREVMRDPDTSLLLMRQLSDMGVRLAMDDFGTGTSSLACLREYPFDVVKVDRSFIKDVATNRDVLSVIHATISLVDNLGKRSVAEGVESGSQAAVLQSLGCHYAQGNHLSPPLRADELMLAKQQRYLLAAS